MPPKTQHETLLTIPFHDLDPLNVVWHGHYWKYFEIARSGFMREIGYDVQQMQASGYAWPVVDCQCRYVKPLSYAQNIKIITTLVEYELRLKFSYLILDTDTGAKLCQASTTQVPVHMETRELTLGVPKVLLEALGVVK